MAADTLYSDAFFTAQADGSYRSACTVLDATFALLGVPERVVDVGCGLGTWLRAAGQRGAREVVGLDGAWVPRERLQIAPEAFRVCDLEAGDFQAVAAGVPFDLVLSLEVAEHLPAGAADRFVAGLCALGEAILFSAAIPHQGGVGHVHEAWPLAWAERFAEHGFHCFDLLRPRLWEDPTVEWWYAQNTMVFARSAAAARLGVAPRRPLPLVHPIKYLALARWADELAAAAPNGVIGESTGALALPPPFPGR